MIAILPGMTTTKKRAVKGSISVSEREWQDLVHMAERYLSFMEGMGERYPLNPEEQRRMEWARKLVEES